MIILVVFGVMAASMSNDSPKSGFYNYKGTSYYYDDGSWYTYNDNTGDYSETYDVPEELENNRDDYYDDLNEYNKQTIDSDWDDDKGFDWGGSDDSGWDSGWDTGGSGGWDSDW